MTNDMDESTLPGTGGEIWSKLLNAALVVPGAIVDREIFLRTALKPYFTQDQVTIAVDRNPAAAGITPDQMRKIAEGSLSHHRARLSAASAAAGLPGGWWIVGTIPLDTAQFIWHAIVAAQKYAYLYGWPDLRTPEGKLDDQSQHLVTLFVGAMLGASGAVAAIEKVAEELARQVAKRLPKVALTKFGIYQLAKQIARWMGIELTKKKFGSYVARIVPVVGGIVSGTVSWVSFSTMSRRLIAHFETQNLADPDTLAHTSETPTQPGGSMESDTANGLGSRSEKDEAAQ